jgi:hypothetical protein
MATASKVKAVDVVEDNIMDEDDYSSEVNHAIGEMPEAEAGSKTTSTANFMGAEPELVDEIEDLGVITPEAESDSYIVRVVEDIGPIYHGSELVDLKKGHKYRVPPHIHRYLSDRDLLWEQQG